VGASLRGRLLTISVHTYFRFNLKYAKFLRQKSKTPGSLEPEACDDSETCSHPPSPVSAPYNVRACHSATLGSALIRQNLFYPLASLDVSGQ